MTLAFLIEGTCPARLALLSCIPLMFPHLRPRGGQDRQNHQAGESAPCDDWEAQSAETAGIEACID